MRLAIVRLCARSAVLLTALAAAASADDAATLAVPDAAVPLQIAVDLPQPAAEGTSWQLVAGDGTAILVQLAPRLAPDGTIAAANGTLLAVIPPGQGADGKRTFKLQPVAATAAAASFGLTVVDDKTLKLSEGEKPVLAYNFGRMTGANVPENDPRRFRACYIHPVWGLDGEVLTDDFSKDHYHHHGIFWAWPHVKVGDKEYDLWVSGNIQQRFVSWIDQRGGPVAAVFGVENGWFVGDGKVATERVWVRVYRAGERERAIDIDIFLVPDVELSLQGAGGKSYGGLTVRFNVRDQKDVSITVPSGPTTADLLETPLEWADLTTQFENAPARSGGAVFVHPQHPNYPPTWLTRHYGPLCVGWPGVHARVYEPGAPHRLPYRIYVHAGAGEHEPLKQGYAGFVAGTKASWSTP